MGGAGDLLETKLLRYGFVSVKFTSMCPHFDFFISMRILRPQGIGIFLIKHIIESYANQSESSWESGR